MISDNLRRWFVVHCIADVVFAIPLLIIPVEFLTLFGWQTVDPLTTRLVAAALFGIGIESYLGRNAGVEAFQGMLNLKLIWSASAIIGMVVTLLTTGDSIFVWGIVGIFVAFHLLWWYYRLQLR